MQERARATSRAAVSLPVQLLPAKSTAPGKVFFLISEIIEAAAFWPTRFSSIYNYPAKKLFERFESVKATSPVTAGIESCDFIMRGSSIV